MVAMKSRRIPAGFVYVISATNGYSKIGAAINPFERFSTIQGCSPLPITLGYICKCTNPVGIEIAAHEALDRYRKHGEWFEVSTSTAIEALRTALRAAGSPPVSAPFRTTINIINQPAINETTGDPNAPWRAPHPHL